MPVYDYKCLDHGLFSDLATIEESQRPMPCPQCSLLSPRVIMLAPEFLDMAPEKRRALTLNEKNRHEPEFSTRDRRESDQQHREGCGCESRKPGSQLFYTAQGDKMFPSMRPWMISH